MMLLSMIFLYSLAIGLDFNQGDPQNGKTIYFQHCLNCHGEKGDGHGPDIQFLTVPPADFHSLQSRSKTDWELMTVITYGVNYGIGTRIGEGTAKAGMEMGSNT